MNIRIYIINNLKKITKNYLLEIWYICDTASESNMDFEFVERECNKSIHDFNHIISVMYCSDVINISENKIAFDYLHLLNQYASECLFAYKLQYDIPMFENDDKYAVINE